MFVGDRGPDLPDGEGLAGRCASLAGVSPVRVRVSAVRVLPLAAASRRRRIAPGGDVGVADVDLQQAWAQVVGAGQAPDIGLGGFPGGGPDADRERRRERPVIGCHGLPRRRRPGAAVSDAMSTPMESRLARVICSVPSRTAWTAAPRIRRSRLPIMPPVRRCRYSSSPVRAAGWWRCRRRLSSSAEISPVQYSPRGTRWSGSSRTARRSARPGSRTGARRARRRCRRRRRWRGSARRST